MTLCPRSWYTQTHMHVYTNICCILFSFALWLICIHVVCMCVCDPISFDAHTCSHITARAELSKMKRAVRASSITPSKRDWRETNQSTPRTDGDQERCSKCAACEVKNHSSNYGTATHFLYCFARMCVYFYLYVCVHVLCARIHMCCWFLKHACTPIDVSPVWLVRLHIYMLACKK